MHTQPHARRRIVPGRQGLSRASRSNSRIGGLPHPATWLNSRRWEDDLSAYQPGRDCGAGPPEPGSEPEFKLVSAPDGRRVAVKRRQT